MCITAILAAASLVASAIGTKASMASADANRDAEIYKANLEQQQADEQRKATEIQAMQQENERAREFEKSRSASLAAIGASGLGEHISFFNAIDPAAKQSFLQDVRNVRLNLVQKQKTLADQIQVAEVSKSIARTNAANSKIGAIANFAQTAMSSYSFMKTNAVPKPTGS